MCLHRNLTYSAGARLHTAPWEALNAAFVRTARAKGTRTGRVTFVHSLRNALLPAITVTGIWRRSLPAVAAWLTMVFGFPGIGKLLIDGILKRAFALVQASIFCVAIFIINIAVDMLYAAIDPRVRIEQ
ncbi:MAG: di/oligopeptide transporter [Devosia sp.]|uniref:ABC transporter permease subunit n=1 Tax=Devosia sp. TaxID=1871048 RepID=UPI00263305F6|nr:ABC transporter permease [Devosia sp.]MDB5537324.1 di/oligopeptide transporter [Devosia sp.]MDB5586439.1 di/oligopeptide transporter [Devosia sp.]